MPIEKTSKIQEYLTDMIREENLNILSFKFLN